MTIVRYQDVLQEEHQVIFCRSSIDIEQVVVSRQDMKLLEVLAGRVREERREEEVLAEHF